MFQSLVAFATRLRRERRARWRFRADFYLFRDLSRQDARFSPRWEDRYPCLNDATATTGYDRHYVLHTGWAARVLARTKPATHVDIGSSLYFTSIASAIAPFEFYDYRPTVLPLPGVATGSADLLNLPFASGEIASLSCMHVIEHVGLARYGDPMDPTGDLKAARELQRVLLPGGQLLMVAPVGRPRVMFNAHRIYSYEQVTEMFSGLRLREFSLIPDDTAQPEMILDAPPDRVRSQSYACGCFWFVKN